MIAHLLEKAAQTFEVPRAALMGQSRQRHIVQARQAVAWALRQTHPELLLAAIGDLLGGRDHTTILWALEAAERRAKEDPRYALRLSALVNGPPSRRGLRELVWLAESEGCVTYSMVLRVV